MVSKQLFYLFYIFCSFILGTSFLGKEYFAPWNRSRRHLKKNTMSRNRSHLGKNEEPEPLNNYPALVTGNDKLKTRNGVGGGAI